MLWSLSSFLDTRLFSSFCVVLPKQFLRYERFFCISGLSFSLIFGGDTRQDSVRTALSFLAKSSPACTQNYKILVHDSARPFVSKEIICKVVDLLGEYTAVDVVLPISDTIKKIKDSHISLIDRVNVFATQTPQGFSLNALQDAYFISENEESSIFTDDISRFIAKGIPIGFVEGEVTNFKITYKNDLEFAKFIANAKMQKLKRNDIWPLLCTIGEIIEEAIILPTT